jgi:hypothetical protein
MNDTNMVAIGSTFGPIEWGTICALGRKGVPHPTLSAMAGVQVVHGVRAADGRFDETPAGKPFLAFHEEVPDDMVLWCPSTGELATLFGRAFALGEDNIVNAATYAFDTHLHLFADPMDWLRDGGNGAVVIDWSRAFDRLRDAPRLAVDETLLATYRAAMKPARLPELAVLTNIRKTSA